MKTVEGEGSSEKDYTEIYAAADTLDGSVIFHTVNDVLGFVLYMHQQIPSTVQDMSIEFDTMHAEYRQLEGALRETEVKGSLRRKRVSRMREIKLGIRRLEKFMSALSNIQNALKMMINELPNVETVILAIGASPLRPQHVYRLNFSHGTSVPRVVDDFARSKAADGLSRKAIRTLISKGAGSATYPGPHRLFLLIEAPSSFNQSMHFLPKRDFRHNKKVLPFKLFFKCRNQHQGVVRPSSDDLILFQCRHVIKGLAMNTTADE
ncbi:hypothetical protein L6164_034561 [Bauhinia variegata]|uniref:Uncharacterized protein n=1 Tax=Bauhinia variegata TaxID=167791 RepID=A0ACB9KW07_BAUVA|nr:hypothetical protein L6164_034561 [Bauhinia variegata]